MKTVDSRSITHVQLRLGQLERDIEARTAELRLREAERAGVWLTPAALHAYELWLAQKKNERAELIREANELRQWLKEAEQAVQLACRLERLQLDLRDERDLLQGARVLIRRLGQALGHPYTERERALLDAIDLELRSGAALRRAG